MATLTALPPTLRSKLTAVARRLRFLRAVRGLSVLLLALAVTAELALLADALLGLSAVVREGILAGWLLLGLGLALFGLVVPLCRRLPPEDLAALIEEKYPELGERLTSTVELAGMPDGPHGSRALINLLLNDTEARATGLDFFRAVPAGGIPALACAAALLALLAFAPALAWPGPYADLGSRFLFPWRLSATAAPYAVEVTPGDTFAAVGRPLTVTAHVVPRKSNAPLPATATLVVTDADGNSSRRPMVVERQDEFSLKLDRVPGSFTYHVEAGDAASSDYQVTAVEPVELAADSPTITVTPPKYARATVPEQTLHGFQDVSALQYSRVRFDFRFTRPAEAVTLTWTAGKGDKAAVALPLDLAADHKGAIVELPAVTGGTYRLLLGAEHDIATEVEPRTLTVRIDQPPAFTRVSVPEDAKFLPAYDRVPLELTAADDVGVAEAAVEYRVGNNPVVSEMLPLHGAGTTEASVRHFFELAGKVREGDVVHYRLRVADNRSVPEVGLKPHVIYHPDGDHWLTLRIARQAESVQEQEIRAQQDEINRKLDAIINDLKREQRGLYKVRQESRAAAELAPEQRRQTRELRDQNRSTEEALHDVAQEAAAHPALRTIADGAEDVAEKQMKPGEAALREAEREAKPFARVADFLKADEQVATALRRVEALRRQNDRLARERLDQGKLEMAAEREKALAERARELAAKDPIKDPAAAKEAAELRRQQEEVANELERLAQQSEALRQALDAARAEQAKQLAERARELAKQQRELAQAEKAGDPQKQAELSDLARKQQELAEKAKRLAQETRPATQAAKASPLKPEEAERATESLKQGDTAEAVRHQDQAAGELDRLAGDLNRAVDLAKDPREAARQLARLEASLKKQLNGEAKNDFRKLEDVRRDQAAVARAAEQISVPPQNQGARQDRRAAADHAAKAEEALKRQDRAQAAAHMEQAGQALRRLADKLPPLDQRQREARAEVERLRQQQEQTAHLAEQAVKQVDKLDPNAVRTRTKLAQLLTEAARRQAETAERLGRLDAPKQEARRRRAQEAVNEALADLMDARPQDVAASQQEARRELERLLQALNGQKPADERARELADRQQRLADAAARAAADPKTPPAKLQDLQQQQRQVAGAAQGLQAPEAPQRRDEAAEAARRAEQAASAKPAGADTAKRMREAAAALDRLARQMAGQESDAARAERLARRQAEAAAQAERAAHGQPGDPEAAKHQRQIADEAKQVRGGDEAQAEKQKALAALAEAQKAGRPDEQARARKGAADALRELADKLAGRDHVAAKTAQPEPGKPVQHTAAKPADGSPRQTARELARRQNEMARATHQAKQQADARPNGQGKPALNQALEQLARQQQRLNEQASQLSADQAQKQLEQAREAMNQAERALAKHDAAQAEQKQHEAANHLNNLAGRLPERTPADEPAARTGEAAAPVPGMPNRQQGEQARALAKEQRELRDAVRKATQAAAVPEGANPLGELVKQQRAIAEKAGALAKDVGKQEGPQAPAAKQADQAAHSAGQTSDRLQAGALSKAQESGRQTAQQLRQLAQQMNQTPRPEGAANTHGPDPVQQARDLAQQQEDVNRRLQAQAGREAQQAQQREQQRNLQREAGELAQNLDRMAGQMYRAPRAQQSAYRASQSGRQAQGQMQQAQAQQGQGNQGQAHQSQERAAQDLDRAAEQAEQASREMAGLQRGQPSASPQAGQAVQEARGQMRQAQQRLNQGEPNGAQNAMQQAAQSLQQAAQQLAQKQQGRPQRNPIPGPRGASGEGRVDSSMLPPDAKKYAGKRWGELPGQLQTRILQDMKAKYGEDYARIIKLYFEQIADTKKD